MKKTPAEALLELRKRRDLKDRPSISEPIYGRYLRRKQSDTKCNEPSPSGICHCDLEKGHDRVVHINFDWGFSWAI